MMKPERARKPIQFAAFTLPWKQLRSHPDIGDYQVNADNSPAVIAAADTGDDISNCAVLIHEIVESLYNWVHGVKEQDVTRFDQMWFKEQEEGKHREDDEPGYDPRAPYRDGHLVAERVEREFLIQCGLTWEQHMENCENAE